MDLGSGKFNLWLKARILISCKLQAPSLTMTEGYYRINLKGINMSESSEELKRIAVAIEEILRLVKKDMEPKKK